MPVDLNLIWTPANLKDKLQITTSEEPDATKIEGGDSQRHFDCHRSFCHSRMGISYGDFSTSQRERSLAWAVAIVLRGLLFWERLRGLSPLLQVKHKDWEASFRLDQAEREVRELPAPGEAPNLRPR